MLIHKGRLSGRTRYAVLEVIKFDKESDVHFVASGFGEKSDWFLNISKNPDVKINTAGKIMAVNAQVLGRDNAQMVFEEYNSRYPHAIKNLARLIGYDIGNSRQDTLEFLKLIPVVAFYPVG